LRRVRKWNNFEVFRPKMEQSARLNLGRVGMKSFDGPEYGTTSGDFGRSGNMRIASALGT
ncbi:hypothetical protein KI387_014499, partial [Taxus chinensis]